MELNQRPWKHCEDLSQWMASRGFRNGWGDSKKTPHYKEPLAPGWSDRPMMGGSQGALDHGL